MRKMREVRKRSTVSLKMPKLPYSAGAAARERAVPAGIAPLGVREPVRGGPALDALLDPLFAARNVDGVKPEDGKWP